MDSQTDVNITINKPTRVLYFSDGIEEIMEEKEVEQQESVPDSSEIIIDPKSLTWGPWFTHYASKSGSKVLNAVDYAGESLASFFGITTPKYLLEINEFERLQEEKRKLDEESSGWVPKNIGGDIPLVMNEPVSVEPYKDP